MDPARIGSGPRLPFFRRSHVATSRHERTPNAAVRLLFTRFGSDGARDGLTDGWHGLRLPLLDEPRHSTPRRV